MGELVAKTKGKRKAQRGKRKRVKLARTYQDNDLQRRGGIASFHAASHRRRAVERK
jgi:hypothetical protein